MVAAVFSMQGMGQLLGAVVALITIVAFKDSYANVILPKDCGQACQIAADRSWRIIIGFGAVPACLALYFRLTLPETPRYTFDIKNDIEKADLDIRSYMAIKLKTGTSSEVPAMPMHGGHLRTLDIPQASWNDARDFFGKWKNLRSLIGVTLSWFFLV
jgi:MFS transporter, PHS family, inorganic phosphate transporter